MADSPPPPDRSTTDPAPKKKRGPNWLPREEEQLAISWINVSEQPEFANNQSGEAFFCKIESDFNTHSKVHFWDHAQIKTRWGVMNTATLKFLVIYNAIERNPPSGSSPDDWLQETMKNYQAQNKNVAFNCLSAWQKLRFAPKWRSDQRPDQPSTPLPNALPDPIKPDLSPSTGITPSARSATSIDRPIGGKAAKRRRIKGYKHDEAIAQANELTEIAQEHLGAFQKGNEILIAKNDIEREKLKIEEEKLVLEKEKVTIKKEFRRSETQMNDYKLLRESKDINNEDTKEVLMIMKQEIKSKWRSRA
ncbi:hypothetical protein PTTG_27564 [Puccinia triticina 1-1 BBBD Race 1]|uniref:NAM-associated domain-containing protein n=1 Tax=Puccinia triticina (isolate 1-1 / race 1 (BBBD)) TaxID=630390 RepID=A0A180GJH1_PUCT1|nr:hypothetical protein PTTG_27564 [Puccinia triticina 1-1 BBBD Race 1]